MKNNQIVDAIKKSKNLFGNYDQVKKILSLNDPEVFFALINQYRIRSNKNDYKNIIAKLKKAPEGVNPDTIYLLDMIATIDSLNSKKDIEEERFANFIQNKDNLEKFKYALTIHKILSKITVGGVEISDWAIINNHDDLLDILFNNDIDHSTKVDHPEITVNYEGVLYNGKKVIFTDEVVSKKPLTTSLIQ
jgi:hypothetical protein